MENIANHAKPDKGIRPIFKELFVTGEWRAAVAMPGLDFFESEDLGAG